MRREFLIGGSEDLHNIFTMEVEVTERNGYKEFTASFNEGELFNIEERNEDAYDWYEMLFDESDAETKLKYLQDGDITKNEFINNCIDEEYDYKDRIDCSCTDFEIYDQNGNGYNFETVGCGQHDPREYDYFKPIKPTVNKLLKFWDLHHLKEITDEEENELNKLIASMEAFEDIEKQLKERVIF